MFVRGRVLGSREFFLYRLDQLVDIKRFCNGAAGPKEFGDIQEIAVTLSPGHGDDFGIDILTCELERRFQAVGIGHQQIHEDKIDRLLLILGQPFASICGLDHAMPCLFENLPQEPTNGLFVVDDEDGGHTVPSTNEAILPVENNTV